jgi:hypothetical protein
MLLAWGTLGTDLWRIEQKLLPLTPGTNAYTLEPSSIDVLDATINYYGQDIVLAPLTREQYIAIPNKGILTRPTQFWIERVKPAVVMHLYPTPDQAYTISYWRIRQPQDVTALFASPDAPVLWAEALAAGLASRLADKFVTDPQKRAELRQSAAGAYAAASGENRERPPITILPNFSYY